MGSKSKAAHIFNGEIRQPVTKCDKCGRIVAKSRTCIQGGKQFCRTHGKTGSAPSQKALKRDKT